MSFKRASAWDRVAATGQRYQQKVQLLKLGLEQSRELLSDLAASFRSRDLRRAQDAEAALVRMFAERPATSAPVADMRVVVLAGLLRSITDRLAPLIQHIQKRDMESATAALQAMKSDVDRFRRMVATEKGGRV